MSQRNTIRFGAAGDLLLARSASGGDSREPAQLLAGLEPLLASCDLLLGNLECTLPGNGATVPTEPRVISTPAMIRACIRAGFNVLSLANNHMFDCGREGFAAVRDLLRSENVAFFGAGDDLEEAMAPAIVERNGLRLAFFGAADERSGARQFAGQGQWGVARLDMDRLLAEVSRVRPLVDHVIVSLHWGEERFSIPSPLQLDQARRLAEGGVSLVLGHHPHVVQGMEIYRGVPIVYSLGNLVACDVHYSNGDVLRWNSNERAGCILLADVQQGRVADVRQVATVDDGRTVALGGHLANGRIGRANRAVARGVTLRRYRLEHLLVKTIRPILSHLRPSCLKTLNWDKLRKTMRGILAARRAH